MTSDNADNPIDDIASDLDDIKTSVEELQVETPAGVTADTLTKMKKALEHASDVADELETEALDPARTNTKEDR